MIKEEQIIKIGTIQKVHGLKGEMNVSIDNPIFDDVKKCPYLVCQLDGIYVPFFIESYRWKGNASILLKFEDIDSMDKANEFCGMDIYFDRRCFSSKEAKEYDAQTEEQQGFIGYHVHDTQLGDLGEIIDINDLTANILFIVDHEGEELMIPAADDLVCSIDDKQKIILMDLPAGLVNMEEAESEDEPFLQI